MRIVNKEISHLHFIVVLSYYQINHMLIHFTKPEKPYQSNRYRLVRLLEPTISNLVQETRHKNQWKIETKMSVSCSTGRNKKDRNPVNWKPRISICANVEVSYFANWISYQIVLRCAGTTMRSHPNWHHYIKRTFKTIMARQKATTCNQNGNIKNR
jgi:hypothetical protein